MGTPIRPSMRVEGRQHLIVDADDTLWENNIYFEQAFDNFISYLNHSAMTPIEIRAVLDEIEVANNKVHGYGSVNFARNLCECYGRLKARDLSPEEVDSIMLLAERIMQQPLEMIDGVQETLEYLVTRHDLTLFTKGHPEEQKMKIERSGLGVYFGHAAIVKEKDAASYRRLIEDRAFDASRSWMVGNSPKSDINPALEAGLNAVYVPHDRTWHLEHTELASGPGQLLKARTFRDLRAWF